MVAILAPDIGEKFPSILVTMNPPGGDIRIPFGDQCTKRVEFLLVFKKLERGIDDFCLAGVSPRRKLLFNEFAAVVGNRNR